jgi:hypothetical protein
MIEQSPLCPERLRQITGSFAWIEPRVFRDGFWTSLRHQELLLYIFLVLVGDPNGLSYYRFDKLCTLLQGALAASLVARKALIHKDLIAFDGHLLQGLSRPHKPVTRPTTPLQSAPHMAPADPATLRQSLRHSLGEDHD